RNAGPDSVYALLSGPCLDWRPILRGGAMSVVASVVPVPHWSALARRAATPLAWALLATLVLVAMTLAGPGPSLSDWLGDTDDAVRLVGVRELLAGAPWFDTTLPRIGAPAPLVSHWSRLIDLPLGLLIGALTPLLGADKSELVTRVVWPTLLFFALAWIAAREAQRRGGTLAAAFTLVFVVTSAVALAQFRPGRIDHHNAQILGAVGGLLFLARSLDERRAGCTAGGLLGLGLAIGYEAIALVVSALGLAVLLAVLQSRRRPRAIEGVARAAAGASGVLLAATAVTIAPWHWLDVRCDALSLNLVALAVSVTAGLWAATWASSRVARCIVLGVGLAVGAAAYAALEPACLAGPFGQVSPALKPIWLDHVTETKSVLWLAARHPAPALAAMLFVLAGAAAQVALWRRRRDMATGLMAAFVVLAAALGFWQIKLLPYASWLAAVPLGIWASGLPRTAYVSAPLMRAAAAVLLSQGSLEAGLGAVVAPLQRSGAEAVATDVEAADPRRPCFLSHSMRPLASLRPGLVAADIDLGPYIVALTPHRVVAAPYHRLAEGILANNAILGGQPEQAARRLAALGVDYLALC